VTGQDVKQLNHDLVALGYIKKSAMDPNSDEFSWATKLDSVLLEAAQEVRRDDITRQPAVGGDAAMLAQVFHHGTNRRPIARRGIEPLANCHVPGMAGLHVVTGGAVVVVGVRHGLDDAEFVAELRQPRKLVADQQAGRREEGVYRRVQ